MLYDAFCSLLEGLIVDIILWISKMSTWLIETSLKVESAMWISDNPLTQELIESIYTYIYGAVLVLVTLKFIWKGFQVYVLWRDGDADVSPSNMLIGACLAIIVSLAFPTVFNVAVSATADIGNGIIDRIDARWLNKPVVDFEDIDARAIEIWEQCFAGLDTNDDYVLTDEEFDVALDINNTLDLSLVYELFPELTNDPSDRLVRTGLSILQLQDRLSIAGIRNVLTDSVGAELTIRLGVVGSLGSLLVFLIYLVLYVIMYVKLLGRSVEMLFLRWGVPIASIGLINSDGGVFPSYIQLMLKQMVTSILQVTAMYLSFYIAMDFDLTHILMALAVIGVAFKGPALLSQVLAPQRQGGGMGQKLHTAMMLRQMWRR